MAISLTCPDRGALARFISGKLSATDRATLERHLAQCPTCRAVVHSMHSADAEGHTLVSDAGNSAGDQTEAVNVSAEVETPGTRPAAVSFLSPPRRPDEIGQLAHYRVLKQLGAGGMGMVFLAEDTGLDRHVALKVMLPDAAAKRDAGQRFLREAKLTASIKNDHIVTIYQVGQHGAVPFLAMELLHGSSLEDRLQTNQQLPLPEVLRIGRELALGLEAAHARGLIHRDIKPANIWLESPNDRVKILDFGLARQTTGGENLTADGMILGTPAYMAPEQAEGKPVDARADLFSLGCVLYRLSTGQMPFTGPTVMSILAALITSTPPSVAKIRPETPAPLTDLIDRLLAKAPASRPANARAVVNELAAIEQSLADASPAGATMHAHRRAATATQQMPRHALTSGEQTVASAPLARPRRFWPWAVAVLLLVAGSIVAWSVMHHSPPIDPPKDPQKGTLVVEADEPGLQIVVKQNGRVVVEPTDKRAIELVAGEYEIELAEKTDRLRLTPSKVSITGEQKASVKVERVSSPDFTPLFNGKDLTGWKTHPDQPGGWTVEDGCLVGRSDTARHLFTLRDDFENFHLRAEVQVNENGNSGIFFRSTFGVSRLRKYPDGYEAQIMHSYPKPNYPLTGAIVGFSQVDERLVKADRWFKLEVIAEANHLTVKVDGKTTTDIVEKAQTYRKGHFALQAMSDNVAKVQTVVRFRQIEIKELPPSPGPTFVPLFNGKDLAGWKQDETDKGKWVVKDGILSSTDSGSGGSNLFSEREYKNFHLRVQAMISGSGEGHVGFRTRFQSGRPPGYEVLINGGKRTPMQTGTLDFRPLQPLDPAVREKFLVRNSTHKANEWVTLEIIAKGNHLVIKVNGQQVAEFVDPKKLHSKGYIALLRGEHGTALKVRAIDILELPD